MAKYINDILTSPLKETSLSPKGFYHFKCSILITFCQVFLAFLQIINKRIKYSAYTLAW